MPHYQTIVAIDSSGSVQGCGPYHKEVEAIAKADIHGGDTAYFYWGTSYQLTDRKSVLDNATGRKVAYCGGTSLIHGLWKAIKELELSCEHLVIATDGEVGDVDQVKAEIDSGDYCEIWRTCKVHIINRHSPSVSVAAPFVNGKPFELFVNGDLYAQSNIGDQEAVKIIKEIKTHEQFAKRYDQLEERIMADRLTGCSRPFRNELLALDARLKRLAPPVESVADEGPPAPVRTPAHVLAAAARLWHDHRAVELAATGGSKRCIASLVNLLDRKGSSCMDVASIRRDAEMRCTAPAPAPAPDDVSYVPSGEEECPVTLAEDVLVAVFEAGTPLIASLDKAVVDDLVGCPLRIFAHKELLTQLRARVLRPLGYSTVKEMDARAMHKDPFTRKALLTRAAHGQHRRALTCCVVMSPSADVAAAGRLNAACLSELLFGNGRLGGKHALWTLVLLWVLRSVDFVTDAVDVDACIVRLVLHTPTEDRVMLGLSALGNQPTNAATVYEALLWAVTSTSVYASQPTKDIMRHLLPAAEVMRDVLVLVGCPELNEDPGALERFNTRVAKLRACQAQIAAVKALVPKAPDTSMTPRHLLMCKAASAFTATAPGVDDMHVTLDGSELRPPTDEERRMLEAAASSNPNDSFGKVVVPDKDERVCVGGLYNDTVNCAPLAKHAVRVSPGSLRPYVKDADGQPWMAAAEAVWGPFKPRCCDVPAVPSFHRRVALETCKAGGVVPDPNDDAHVAAVLRHELADIARKLGQTRVVPTVPACFDVLYRKTLSDVRAALEERRELGLPCEPADVVHVLEEGVNRERRAELELVASP